MKVGIHSHYLDILGGGERYVLTIAEYFLHKGHQVDLFWDKTFDKTAAENRFSLNLEKVRITPYNKIKSKSYDMIFFDSNGSIPLSFAKKNYLLFQTPFKKMPGGLGNKLKLKKITKIFCNSNFTKSFIDKAYQVNCKVIYPPVDLEKFRPGKKEKIILSAGRFFAPSHPKNQELLIDSFKKISKKLPGWKLILVGGIAPEHQEKLAQLIEITKGFNIEIKDNVRPTSLYEVFSKASLYWHATGFGYDLEKDPQKAEHFGITTVESMSAGAVPLVFKGGGQQEIIEDRVSGVFWQTPKELEEKTVELIGSSKNRESISKKAIERSTLFSKQKFFANLEALCG